MSDQTPSDPQPPPAPAYGQQYGQPQYGQPQYGQPGYYPPPPAPTPGKATTALILGIAGLLCCPLILSVPAWIVGHSSVKEIDASNGALGGRGTANAGYILGIIGTVWGLVGIVVTVLLFSFGSVTCHSTSNSTDDNTDFSFHCS